MLKFGDLFANFSISRIIMILFYNFSDLFDIFLILEIIIIIIHRDFKLFDESGRMLEYAMNVTHIFEC